LGLDNHAILLAFGAQAEDTRNREARSLSFHKNQAAGSKVSSPQAAVSGRSRLNREGKEKLLPKKRHPLQRGTLWAAVQATH